MLTDVTANTQTLTFTQVVKTHPKHVYWAFTNAMGLREWFCDIAQVDARENGALFLSWSMGYFAAGRFSLLKPDEKVAFSWQGEGEPGVTGVEVTLEKQGDDTRVTLQHSGIGQGGAWNGTAEQLNKEWTGALENLASILETGLDLRIMRRPMLGIMPSALDAKTAEKLGVPVQKGLHLDSIVEGMGAQAAGLQKNDVIVAMDGKSVVDYPSLVAAMGSHQAGDNVEVEYYRGGQKKTVSMKLFGRPKPDVPATIQGLADQMEKQFAELSIELDDLLQGVTEDEASRKPAPDEWNAKEVLAHLIWSQRWMQNVAFGLVGGDDNVAWPDNNPMHLAMTLGAYSTLPELADTLKRFEAASVETARTIPPEFLARKGSYLRLAQFWLNFSAHTRQHFDQMRAAIESARQSAAA